MCGIAAIVSLTHCPVLDLETRLAVMNRLLSHRGPDGQGSWVHPSGRAGLAHRRLSIIDLAGGAQPMFDAGGNGVTFNGEIYNYLELRDELGHGCFRTRSDTETILAGYRAWGKGCPTHLRGMFAFALWDENGQSLFCARDRFGIKPLYYAEAGDALYIASEAKALLPFLPDVATDEAAFKEYLMFQFCLAGKTLFKGVREVPPGHFLTVENGRVEIKRYWDVYYNIDFDHTAPYFYDRLRQAIDDSVGVHLRSDVPLGAYVSGGMDSGIVAAMAANRVEGEFLGFTGTYRLGPEYDETGHAQAVASENGFELLVREIGPRDFLANIQKVIFHLDFPVAGPGAFSQFMVSELAATRRKVVLGGQGGDEIFGGYARYLIAYFEQCIKGAIEGTLQDGNFIVTYESIIPNLKVLRGYKPLLQEFWREGLFESMDRRYFRLVNRASSLTDEIRWERLEGYSAFETFKQVFNASNGRKWSYFDLMTHFDFKTLLPALLHVEDRVSMAHGLESRVPFLDHPLVELAATIPSNIKFQDGTMKRALKEAVGKTLPLSVLNRQDKMGFPTPVAEWFRGECRDFVREVFLTPRALSRDLVDTPKVLKKIDNEAKFSRRLWGLLCLELWQQEFHDQAHHYQRLIKTQAEEKTACV